MLPVLLSGATLITRSTQPHLEQLQLRDIHCENTRSVLNIAWSCISTIFLCTWVSVHPNIPRKGENRAVTLLRRVKLMFCGIISPEAMFVFALRQTNDAFECSGKYKSRGWTLTHGFFIVMGGFSLRRGNEDLGVLSPELLGQLIESGDVEFPSITEEEIQDKSKGDEFSKGLVALQTLWFFAQFGVRRLRNFEQTQLEFITLTLCVPVLAMSLCWVKKPLDVKCAAPVYLKEGSTYIHQPHLRRAERIREEDAPLLVLAQREASDAALPEATNSSTVGDVNTQLQLKRAPRMQEDDINLMVLGQHDTNPDAVPPEASNFLSNSTKSAPFFVRTWGYIRRSFLKLLKSLTPPPPPSDPIFSIKWDRWKNRNRGGFLSNLFTWIPVILFHMIALPITIPILFAEAIWGLLGLNDDGSWILPGSSQARSYYTPSRSIQNHASNWTQIITGAIFYTSVSSVVSVALTVVTWTSYFPTRAESIIWRSTSVIVTVFPIYAMLTAVVEISVSRKAVQASVMPTGHPRHEPAPLGRTVFRQRLRLCLVGIFIIARMVLIFEAFFMLRRPSPSGSESVLCDFSWQDYVPHL